MSASARIRAEELASSAVPLLAALVASGGSPSTRHRSLTHILSLVHGAFRLDPYNVRATLLAAIVYRVIDRRTCVANLLARIDALRTRPALAKDASHVIGEIMRRPEVKALVRGNPPFAYAGLARPTPPPGPRPQPLSLAQVVRLMHTPKNVAIFLNRGRAHGVERGWRGWFRDQQGREIPGSRFVVVKVTMRESVAYVNLGYDLIASNRSHVHLEPPPAQKSPKKSPRR